MLLSPLGGVDFFAPAVAEAHPGIST